jgi:hypothetical protein
MHSEVVVAIVAIVATAIAVPAIVRRVRGKIGNAEISNRK